MIAGQRLAPVASLAVSLVASLAVTAALLQPLTAQAADNDALLRLERMRSAAMTGNYRGTMVFSTGGSISSARVWHYCVGDQTYERLEAQDGRQQRVLRHNDELRTYWPQTHRVVLERRVPLAGWSAKPQAIEERALDSYALRVEGQARVAGREAEVLLLEPRDALRYAQRLWTDRATGLMLRADVLGAGNAVLETAAFSEIEIGVKPDPQRVLQDMRSIDSAPQARAAARTGNGAASTGHGAVRSGDAVTAAAGDWRVLRPQQRSTQLEAEGWTMKAGVPGFRLASCAVRGIESDGEEVSVLQAVYSDGLTHVSLFLEPYRAGRHHDAARAQLGATRTVTRRLGEHWITVVGDAPAATLKRFADALEPLR